MVAQRRLYVTLQVRSLSCLALMRTTVNEINTLSQSAPVYTFIMLTEQYITLTLCWLLHYIKENETCLKLKYYFKMPVF